MDANKLEEYYNKLGMYHQKVRDFALDVARNADRKLKEAQRKQQVAESEAIKWKIKYDNLRELMGHNLSLAQPTKSARRPSTSNNPRKSFAQTPVKPTATSSRPLPAQPKRPTRTSLTPSPTRLSRSRSPSLPTPRRAKSPELKQKKQPPKSALKPITVSQPPESDSEPENTPEKPAANHTKSRNAKSGVKKSTMRARVSKGYDLNGDTRCTYCGNYFVGEKGLLAHIWRCPKKPQEAKSSKRPAEKSPSRPARTNKKKPTAESHERTIEDLVALVNEDDDDENDEHDEYDSELHNPSMTDPDASIDL